jgi:hypothetical protein
MNVKLFRLNSGEEILTRYEMTKTHILMKDPAILVPMGKGQIGLMPWLMYSKASKGIEIPLSYVAFSVEPLDDLKSQYDASLNTGIVTPSKSVSGTNGLKLTT